MRRVTLLRVIAGALIIAGLFAWPLHPQLLVPIGICLGAIALFSVAKKL